MRRRGPGVFGKIERHRELAENGQGELDRVAHDERPRLNCERRSAAERRGAIRAGDDFRFAVAQRDVHAADAQRLHPERIRQRDSNAAAAEARACDHPHGLVVERRRKRRDRRRRRRPRLCVARRRLDPRRLRLDGELLRRSPCRDPMLARLLCRDRRKARERGERKQTAHQHRATVRACRDGSRRSG